MNITEKEYEQALAKIEELLSLVKEDTLPDDPNAKELVVFSEIAEAYEAICFPVESPSSAQS
ncbi:MAG: hypothetical protein LUD17_10190 [Bacteroidales bacterium]|nr:hypothetical protein [Bacteroidales bacterium]